MNRKCTKSILRRGAGVLFFAVVLSMLIFPKSTLVRAAETITPAAARIFQPAHSHHPAPISSTTLRHTLRIV